VYQQLFSRKEEISPAAKINKKNLMTALCRKNVRCLLYDPFHKRLEGSLETYYGGLKEELSEIVCLGGHNYLQWV
jgi:hypothetical protein